MSGKQVGEGSRRSRAEVAEITCQYEGSGLSRQEFCGKHGLALSTLQRHQKRREQARKPARESRLIAVELSSGKAEEESKTGSQVTVVLSGGRRIEVKPGFDRKLLGEVIGVLEQV